MALLYFVVQMLRGGGGYEAGREGAVPLETPHTGLPSEDGNQKELEWSASLYSITVLERAIKHPLLNLNMNQCHQCVRIFSRMPTMAHSL